MEEKKSKIGSVIGTGVLAVTCLVVGYVACQLTPKAAGHAKEGMDPRRMSATVAVTNGVMREYNLPEKYVAWVEPVQEVALIPEVEGYISEIRFKEGDHVKEGQILYVLDPEKYQSQVNQRKSDLYVAEVEASRAKRQLERMKSTDARGITGVELDNAVAADGKAQAAIMQAKANLVVAEYYLRHTVIKAPFDGRIGKSDVHKGDFVAPSKGSLATVVQYDPIRMKFPITDRAALQYQFEKLSGKVNDRRYRVRLTNGEIYDKDGTVDFLDNHMSGETATMIMWVRFANPDNKLTPDAYMNLLMDYKVPPKYLCVPQQCVVDLTGGALGVWVVGEDMTVNPRPVETREAYEGWTPIVSGLKPGEKVVLSGVGKLMAGQKVTLAEPTSNDDINPQHKSRLKGE